MEILKIEKKVEEMLTIFKITVSEIVAGIFLCSGENSCDSLSRC